MTRYYIGDPTAERGFVELTETEFLQLFGDETVRPYATNVYTGQMVLDDVPDVLRQTVQETVARRVERFGSYGEQTIGGAQVLRIVTGIEDGITRSQANALRSVVETAAESLDDKTASTAAVLFPSRKEDGSLIKAGTRINEGGVIKRAAVDLWDTPENSPQTAPTLWEDIEYREGYRIIPETITAAGAFALDEIGWWNDQLYKSLRDGNVYNPSVTPEWWEKLNE